MPRTTLPRLAWLRQPDAQVAPTSPPSPLVHEGADPLAAIAECGIGAQIADHRRHVLRRLATLLRRHADADAAHRRGFLNQVRSMARCRREALAACRALQDPPSTMRLPASAVVLLARSRAALAAPVPFDAAPVERERCLLADKAAGAVAAAAFWVRELERQLERLGAAAWLARDHLRERMAPASLQQTRPAELVRAHEAARAPLPQPVAPMPPCSATRRTVAVLLEHIAFAAEVARAAAELADEAARVSCSVRPARFAAPTRASTPFAAPARDSADCARREQTLSSPLEPDGVLVPITAPQARRKRPSPHADSCPRQREVPSPFVAAYLCCVELSPSDVCHHPLREETECAAQREPRAARDRAAPVDCPVRPPRPVQPARPLPAQKSAIDLVDAHDRPWLERQDSVRPDLTEWI